MGHRGAQSPCARLCALAAVLLLTAASAQAKIITIEPLPPAFEENPPYGEIVREIRIEGNEHTRESVIRTALKSEVGHPYTEENARLDLLWVSRLGAFTAVSFRTEPVADGIALIVVVEEATPYIPSLSFALTQENGLEIGPALSSSNLFGTAARASAYFRFGGATNVGIRYTGPQLPGRNLTLYSYRAEYFHRERTNELLEFKERTDEVFFELRKTASGDMRTGLRFRYIGLRADRNGVTLGDDRSDAIPSLGLFIQHDSRNGVYPTGGWFADIEVGRYGILGGDGQWWRLDLDARHYVGLPFLGWRHSLALTTFASLQNGVIGETIPAHQEFYIGGTNSVRGWSLGSRQGKHQWLTTVEYWFRLVEQQTWRFWFVRWRMGCQIGVFGDVGTAWSAPDELDQNWIGGYGAGFRLTMPVVTMLRIDLAVGEADAGVRLFVGGGEKADAQKLRVR